VVDQDLHLLEYAADAGTGVVLLVNKWDGWVASIDCGRRQRYSAVSESHRGSPSTLFRRCMGVVLANFS